MVSGVPKAVFGMLNDLDNKMVSYTDDTTFCIEDASLSDHINVANSLNIDLFNIQVWCST